MEDIKIAKVNLYKLLLMKDTNKLTNNEIELMYYLSKDSQIQEMLNDRNN